MADLKEKSNQGPAKELVQDRQYFDKRYSALFSERESWMDHWKQITDYLYPVGGRYFIEDRNEGGKRNDKILNDTGTEAHNILAAGMMAVMSNPARPWFVLELTDTDLMKFPAVRQWLEHATDVLRTIFLRSNVYRVLHQLYLEVSGFGSACAFMQKNFQDLMRLYPTTIGEFLLAQDNEYRVNTLYRRFEMPVSSLVRNFGLNKVSSAVQNMWGKGNFDEWVPVIHAIEPRIKRDPTRSNAKNMPWVSVYWEEGNDSNKTDSFLSESGFKRFRALCPRWHVTGQDIYGTCPGMQKLGDIQTLQDDELTLATVKDYQARPPLQIPSALRNTADTLPGGESFFDETTESRGIRSAFDVKLEIQALLLSMEKTELRIRRGFFNDLLVAVLRDDQNSPPSARSPRAIDEKHEEKLLILGPTFERHQNEVFDPLIDNGFEWAFEEGLFGPPPPEIGEAEITVKYVSMLAQAQRAVGISSMDRIIGTVQVIEGLIPGTRYKLNGDVLVDEYAEALGVPVETIVPNDQAVFVRRQEQKARENLQRAALLQQAAETGKTLSETNIQDSSALSELGNPVTEGVV